MKLGLRLAIGFSAALATTGFVTVTSPPTSSADCDGTQWWDPVASVCRPLLAPDCGGGNWWDPVGNTCRPLASAPLGCDFGSYWDPVANVCRTVLVLPPD
ncbi:MAG: hypothetical protein ACM4D3_11880 [Candidatus Sericytochromatia bacterium]